MLFLFFNCVCAAAPVAKLSDDNLKDAISHRIGSPEGEKETHVASGYVNQIRHFSVRAHSCRQNSHFSSSKYAVAISVAEPSNTYISNAGTLPLPGSDAFLFRYNLF